jgi:TatD DNase family protein
MTLVDTHCHLHFKEFDPDREQVIRRAQETGVKRLVIVGTDPRTNEQAHDLAGRHARMVHTVGLHPHSAHEADETWFEKLEQQVRTTKPAAIGEIGLDYFKSEAAPEVQQRVFRGMLRLAKKYDLPAIVHSRNAAEDTYAVLKEEAPRGVMHCFSYDTAAMERFVSLGLFISFACNLTFKNAGVLLETAKATPEDRLVVETDSPYLSPDRGRRNEPANLAVLVPFLAAARGVDASRLAERSTANAERLFGLG